MFDFTPNKRYRQHMQQLRFTKQGYEDLQKKYKEILDSRPGAVEHLRKSREMGDLSENGYYKSSRAKLSFIDRQLREMSSSLKRAVIISSTGTTTVDIGCVVILMSNGIETRFEIVGDLEADPTQKRISLLSPLGTSLKGKRVGEHVVLEAPSGKTEFVIKSIS